MITYLIKMTIFSSFLWMLQLKYNTKLKVFQTTKGGKLKLTFKTVIIFLVFLQKYLVWRTLLKSKTFIIELSMLINTGGDLIHYVCIMYKTHVHSRKIAECTNILITFETDQAIPKYLWYTLVPFGVQIICLFFGAVIFYWDEFLSVRKIRALYFFTIDLYVMINATATEISYVVLHIVLLKHFKSINCSLKKNILNFETFLAKRSILCKVGKQINNIYSPFLLLIFFLYTFSTIGLLVLIYFSFDTNSSKVSNGDSISFSISLTKLLILVWTSSKCMCQVFGLNKLILNNFLWI